MRKHLNSLRPVDDNVTVRDSPIFAKHATTMVNATTKGAPTWEKSHVKILYDPCLLSSELLFVVLSFSTETSLIILGSAVSFTRDNPASTNSFETDEMVLLARSPADVLKLQAKNTQISPTGHIKRKIYFLEKAIINVHIFSSKERSTSESESLKSPLVSRLPF